MSAIAELEIEPKSLGELLALSPDELRRVDIGRANLLCAEGLPGAEELDLDAYLQRLDTWAERARRITDRHLRAFQDHREEYDNSEPLWRAVALARFLSNECRSRYNPTQINPADWDFSDSRDQFIHGLLGPTRTGTCSSLPVLLTAIGRRLGYPLRIAFAPGHVFCRWDGENHVNPAWRDRFNIEFNGDGIDKRTDESYYERPRTWPAELIASEARRPVKEYLRSLEPLEEIAMSLSQRGNTLEAVGRLEEAWEAFVSAKKYAPHSERYVQWCKLIHEKKMEQVLKPFGFTPKMFCDLFELRLRGSNVRFPWEFRSPWCCEVPKHPVHPMLDPLGAAMQAVATRVLHNQRPPRVQNVPPNRTHVNGRRPI